MFGQRIQEVLVIEGSFFDEYGDYPAGTWLRNPDQSSHNAFTRDNGALLYLKAGHLPAAGQNRDSQISAP